MDCGAQTELDGSLRRGTQLEDVNQVPAPKTDDGSSGVTTAADVKTTGTEPEPVEETAGDILDDLSKDELAAEAADRNIKGRSSMTKAQLVAALRGGGE